MARAIINIKCTPAMTAVLAELGGLPIYFILDPSRIKFFHRIMYILPETRLCKQIFLAMANEYSDGMT